MNINHSVISSVRLDLSVFTITLIDAFESRDRNAAENAAGVSFPIPFVPPPETGDVLDYFRSVVTRDNSNGLYLPRLIINRDEQTVVGSIGVNEPNDDGIALMGYSVYPLFEGNGYASEAAKTLVEYALDHAELRAIRATIELSNCASQSVAARAGLVQTNETIEDDGLTLSIWERTRDQS